jgi:hypothetical protein
MGASDELKTFLDAARSQGLSEEAMATLLRGREWPQEDVHRALADHFEARAGIRIPSYQRSSSAKDAFLYLFCFSTLATWTIGLGSVVFTMIERWFPDPLSPSYFYRGAYYQIADSLACVIIAFPVYLWVTRSVLVESRQHPEKLESSIRKWLTYIALLIAAGVVIGDLIAFLTFFLRGELTARFVGKVATVLFIAGGVFWYYFGSVRGIEASAAPRINSVSTSTKP